MGEVNCTNDWLVVFVLGRIQLRGKADLDSKVIMAEASLAMPERERASAVERLAIGGRELEAVSERQHIGSPFSTFTLIGLTR